MGILDFLKKVAKNNIKNEVNQSRNSDHYHREESKPKPKVSNYKNDGLKTQEDFKQLLEQMYPDYRILENGRLTDLGIQSPYDFPFITFILRDQSRVAGVIVLMENGLKAKNRPYVLLKNECLSRGLPHLAFFLHLPNRLKYCQDRIAQTIK